MKKTIEFLNEKLEIAKKKTLKYEALMEKRNRKHDKLTLEYFRSQENKIRECLLELGAKK